MKSLLLFVMFGLAAGALAEPVLYKVVPGSPRTQVQFKSEATLETVIGHTTTATGYIELDSTSIRSQIHVDLASLKTGMAMRDQHMRKDHLQTDQFPEAVFTVSVLVLPVGGLPDGVRTPVTLRGDLTLHGITHQITPETYLTIRNSDRTLRVESTFFVALADYRIPHPQFLMMRLSEQQQVSVDITAVNEGSEELSRTGYK